MHVLKLHQSSLLAFAGCFNASTPLLNKMGAGTLASSSSQSTALRLRGTLLPPHHRLRYVYLWQRKGERLGDSHDLL